MPVWFVPALARQNKDISGGRLLLIQRLTGNRIGRANADSVTDERPMHWRSSRPFFPCAHSPTGILPAVGLESTAGEFKLPPILDESVTAVWWRRKPPKIVREYATRPAARMAPTPPATQARPQPPVQPPPAPSIGGSSLASTVRPRRSSGCGHCRD